MGGLVTEVLSAQAVIHTNFDGGKDRARVNTRRSFIMRKKGFSLFGIVVLGAALFTQAAYAQAGGTVNVVLRDTMPLFKGIIASGSATGDDSSYVQFSLGKEPPQNNLRGVIK
jgi:hypothetical protein